MQGIHSSSFKIAASLVRSIICTLCQRRRESQWLLLRGYNLNMRKFIRDFSVKRDDWQLCMLSATGEWISLQARLSRVYPRKPALLPSAIVDYANLDWPCVHDISLKLTKFRTETAAAWTKQAAIVDKVIFIRLQSADGNTQLIEFGLKWIRSPEVTYRK